MLYSINCFELFKKLEDKSVNHIITDPPYGISQEIIIHRKSNPLKYNPEDNQNISLDFGEWDKFESREDFLNFTYKWVDASDRVLKEGGNFISFLIGIVLATYLHIFKTKVINVKVIVLW